MKWQIVHTTSGYHARLLAQNGEPICWTETYARKEDANRAIMLTVNATFSVRGGVEQVEE